MSRARTLMAFSVGAALSVAALAPLPAQPWRGGEDGGRGSCTYFADANYQGMRGTLADGDETTWVGNAWNDRISSVQCDPGCTLEAYEHIDFGGARQQFRGNVGFVGPGWNDRASSLRVQCSGREWGREAGRERRERRRGWERDEVRGSFYRQQNRPEVILQHPEGDYCHVQNPAQMEAYGGFGQVRVVPVLTPRGRFTGPCAWPNGYYRRSNDPTVWSLYGRSDSAAGARACRVANPAQMERFGGFGQVRVVDANADLLRERREQGLCGD